MLLRELLCAPLYVHLNVCAFIFIISYTCLPLLVILIPRKLGLEINNNSGFITVLHIIVDDILIKRKQVLLGYHNLYSWNVNRDITNLLCMELTFELRYSWNVFFFSYRLILHIEYTSGTTSLKLLNKGVPLHKILTEMKEVQFFINY